jgi:hypothetical protein
MMLDHERLDVYQCAIRFVATVLQLLAQMPQGQAQYSWRHVHVVVRVRVLVLVLERWSEALSRAMFW